MSELSDLIVRLSDERPVQWEDLPDIELYKDQVLNYMERQHILQSEDEYLTGAMINNYIKIGLLPRANGKKYSKDHLAYLTAICAFKQVLSVTDTGLMLRREVGGNIGEFYKKYCDRLDAELNSLKDLLNSEVSDDELSEIAFSLAISSYAHKMVCERILSILREKEQAAQEEQAAAERAKEKAKEKKDKESAETEKDDKKAEKAKK